MTRLAEIETHVAGIGELLDIVGAMRSLASMRVREAHHALAGIRRYAGTMAAAIGSVILLMPDASLARGAAPGRRALVVCTAEHGFVGGFNARVLDAAERLFDRDDTCSSSAAAAPPQRGNGAGQLPGRSRWQRARKACPRASGR
jgi:F-type H+-transporting ATPase subunit gamma